MAASRRSRRAADVDPLPGVRRRVRRNVRLDATATAAFKEQAIGASDGLAFMASPG